MVRLNHTENMYFGASDEIIRRARLLRSQMTDAEKRLWEVVNQKKFHGLRFRRQHPIGKLIVDFYCHPQRLVIEIDGNVHNEPIQMEKDENRTYYFQELGLRELRFTNQMIFTNMAKVLTEIEDFCQLKNYYF